MLWQFICLCLPTSSQDDRRHLGELFHEALQASNLNQRTIDVGLAFLPFLTPPEAHTVLSERRQLVLQLQAYLETTCVDSDLVPLMQYIVKDHIQTLLATEQAWLDRTLPLLAEV